MIIDYVLSQAVGPVLAPGDTTRLKLLDVQDKEKFCQQCIKRSTRLVFNSILSVCSGCLSSFFPVFSQFLIHPLYGIIMNLSCSIPKITLQKAIELANLSNTQPK